MSGDSSLVPQAEALATAVWQVVDWYDEAVKAELAKPNAIGIPGSIIGEASDKLKAQLLAALQRVQAETWEQAAQIADAHKHAEPLDDLEPPADSIAKYSNTTCRMIASALRARAAQPQEPTTKVGDR